jgi:hypothetical protein
MVRLAGTTRQNRRELTGATATRAEVEAAATTGGEIADELAHCSPDAEIGASQQLEPSRASIEAPGILGFGSSAKIPAVTVSSERHFYRSRHLQARRPHRWPRSGH